jgi:branched-chain amino acid transport system permease protein
LILADQFLQYLISALALGSLYALITIGCTMVYGILGLINFAHGEVFMLGGYIAFYAVTIFLMPWWAGFIAALGLTGILGVALERLAYRPLRHSSKNSIMVGAVGMSFLMQNLAIVIFGGRQKGFPIPEIFNKIVQIHTLSVIYINIIIPVITAVLLTALLIIVHKTKIGTAMRAVAADLPAARLMGIDVNKTVSFTFGTASVLAALGGVMWALKYPQLNPSMGVIPGLKCFIAAIIGGIGNISGAVLGGLLLGLIEIMVLAVFPALTAYRDAFVFVLLIIVLLLKPSVLLGKNQTEKA